MRLKSGHEGGAPMNRISALIGTTREMGSPPQALRHMQV